MVLNAFAYSSYPLAWSVCVMKKRLPEWDLIQAAQMRMFFASCGVRKDTVEAAVNVRSNKPIERKPKPLPLRRRRKLGSSPPS